MGNPDITTKEKKKEKKKRKGVSKQQQAGCLCTAALVRSYINDESNKAKNKKTQYKAMKRGKARFEIVPGSKRDHSADASVGEFSASWLVDTVGDLSADVLEGSGVAPRDTWTSSPTILPTC